jgi:phytoene/squalene synthetase
MRTFEDLQRYCYRVASTVGLLVVHVLGYRNPRALDFAKAMGIAVQLTNVLRDVGTDAAAGRVYLPQEDLERMHVAPQDLGAGRMTDEIRLLLGRIYRALLEELQRRGFPCLQDSLRLSKRRRAAIAASVWFRRHPVA